MIAPLLRGGVVPVEAGAKVMAYNMYTIDLLPWRIQFEKCRSLHNINSLPFILFPYGRSDAVYAEGYQELAFVWVAVGCGAPAQGCYFFGVGFFAGKGEVQTFSLVALYLFEKNVSSMGIRLQILVAQPVSHDKRDGGIVLHMGSGVDCHIYIAFGICCGQYA
jgi:hypothetical protein